MATSTVDTYNSHFTAGNVKSKIDGHFNDLAKNFDYLYEPIHQAQTPMLISKLQMTPDDLLLDIGAATGQQAHLIWKQVGLKNPVTCVEPCQAFFEHASKVDGIVPVIQTAEQFCDGFQDYIKEKQPFDKVLLMGVIDHLDDVIKRIGQIIDCLPKNGVLLITNPPRVGLDLPVKPLYLQNLAKIPDFFDIIVPYVKNRDDVIAQVTTEESSYRIPKSRWYFMIRSRFWSSFRRYTDEELEESFKELDNGRFKGVKDDELITIVDKNTVVKVTKN